LLYRIYNAYFAPCHYLPFSRKVAFSQPDAAVAYLKAHRPANGLFIDISSTGATWEKLDADICIEALIYSDLHFYTRDKPRLPAGFSFVSANSDCGQTNVLLEVCNCGDHGYPKSINFLSEGLMTAEYEPVQLDTRLIDEIHKPVRLAEGLAPVSRDELLSELRRVSTGQLLALFGRFAQELCNHTHLTRHPALSVYFRDELAYKAMLQDADKAAHRA
jgi:hypothetical protein